MISLSDFAKKELILAGFDPNSEDETKKLVYNDVLEFIELFSKQQQLGHNIQYCVDIFAKLAYFQPLTPITDDEDEWTDIDENFYQHKRCPEVFKDKKTGTSCTMYGYVFKDQNEKYFINEYSLKKISFPYAFKEAKVVDVVTRKKSNDNQNLVDVEYPDWIIKEHEKLNKTLSKEKLLDRIRKKGE